MSIKILLCIVVVVLCCCCVLLLCVVVRYCVLLCVSLCVVRGVSCVKYRAWCVSKLHETSLGAQRFSIL